MVLDSDNLMNPYLLPINREASSIVISHSLYYNLLIPLNHPTPNTHFIMSGFIADAMAAEKGMTQGQGFTGKVEDGVTDGAANNFVDNELAKGEADMGMVRDQFHYCSSILVLIQSVAWTEQHRNGGHG